MVMADLLVANVDRAVMNYAHHYMNARAYTLF